MCWRQVSSKHQTLLIILAYFVIYHIISLEMPSDSACTFLREESGVGGKYAFVFLAAGERAPAFSDADGGDVFERRRCGGCVLTNNRGFLPLEEFDAVLVLGERARPPRNHSALFRLAASRRCVLSKLARCAREPRVTSFATGRPYDLCALCQFLLKKRKKPQHWLESDK